MGILSWLKKASTGDVSEPIEFAAGEEDFHGLNMKDALDAHAAWTHRLNAKLKGESHEEMEIATIAVDHKCELGRWLHNEARQTFGTKEEYSDLKRTHAEFHLKAGEVLNNVINGNESEAKDGIREIRQKSGEVQLSLIRLYSATQA